MFQFKGTFSTVKRHFPEAHIVQCKGLVSKNIDYIKKTGKWEDTEKAKTKIEGTFEEWGKQPPDSKGKHYDMTELYQMVVDGMSNAEILAVNQDYILNIDKIDKLRNTLLTEKYEETPVLERGIIYVYGDTRTGKTKGIFKEHGYKNVYRVTEYEHPFDSYKTQPIIFFDEFRSSLKLSDMLIYTDIHPTELKSRYCNKVACYNKIYIASNWELEKQYADKQKSDAKSWEAFLARIKEIRHYIGRDKFVTYSSVEDYFNHNEKFHELTEDEKEDNPFVEPELPEQLDLPL